MWTDPCRAAWSEWSHGPASRRRSWCLSVTRLAHAWQRGSGTVPAAETSTLATATSALAVSPVRQCPLSEAGTSRFSRPLLRVPRSSAKSLRTAKVRIPTSHTFKACIQCTRLASSLSPAYRHTVWRPDGGLPSARRQALGIPSGRQRQTLGEPLAARRPLAGPRLTLACAQVALSARPVAIQGALQGFALARPRAPPSLQHTPQVLTRGSRRAPLACWTLSALAQQTPSYGSHDTHGLLACNSCVTDGITTHAGGVAAAPAAGTAGTVGIAGTAGTAAGAAIGTPAATGVATGAATAAVTATAAARRRAMVSAALLRAFLSTHLPSSSHVTGAHESNLAHKLTWCTHIACCSLQRQRKFSSLSLLMCVRAIASSRA